MIRIENTAPTTILLFMTTSFSYSIGRSNFFSRLCSLKGAPQSGSFGNLAGFPEDGRRSVRA
jgi:hypothetical protein